jgi:uncharacterized protein
LPSFTTRPIKNRPPGSSDRLLQFALFVTAGAWFLFSQAIAARAAQGIALRFLLLPERPLMAALFLLFLLAVGFSILQALGHRSGDLRDVLGLPQRSTSAREWTLGAAIGWGGVVLAILPMALAGALQIHLWTTPRSFWLLALNLATIAVAALAEEVAFRGYPYRRLIEAIGPVAATLSLSLFFGLIHSLNPGSTLISTLITTLAGLLLAIGWLRTHGLWLPWGFHFAWNASLALLFGLPVSGVTYLSSVVQTSAFGRLWLTGGDYGPEGAVFTAVVLLGAIAAVILVTRDYSWDYTHRPIVAAGYAMDAPIPAAHAAHAEMEQQQAPKPASATLVQILPATPQSRSVTDPPKP